MGFELVDCPICGKMFPPAPQHALTDGHGNLVCSCHCSEEARKNEDSRLKRLIKEDDKRKLAELESDRARKNEKNRGETKSRKPRYSEPVLIFDIHGNFIRKANSQREAARITGCHESAISLVCNGSQESTGGFTFRKERDLKKSSKRYTY